MENNLNLLYVNVLNHDWEGYNLYEFIFSDETDVETIAGEEWDSLPASYNPTPPNKDYVKRVGQLRTEVEFHVIQHSSMFSVYDAVDGVVALAWEEIMDYDVYPAKRLVFNYGDSIEKVERFLYSRDLILDYKFGEDEY